MQRNSRELDNLAGSIYNDNKELDDLPYYNHALISLEGQ